MNDKSIQCGTCLHGKVPSTACAGCAWEPVDVVVPQPPAGVVQRVQDRLLAEFREAWHDRPVDDPIIWRRLALAALEEAEKKP